MIMTNSPPSSTELKMTKGKKTVRFCDECENVVHHSSDPEHVLTKEERKPLHYSVQELAQIKDEIYLGLGKYKANPNKGLAARRFHTRGLETLIGQEGTFDEALEYRQMYVRDVVALYKEFHNPLENGLDAIRDFAIGRNKTDRKEALKRAKQDETEAWKVYKEDKMRFRRTTSRGERAKSFVASLVPGMNSSRSSGRSTESSIMRTRTA